VPKKDGTFQVV
jgi:hypothetical protein